MGRPILERTHKKCSACGGEFLLGDFYTTTDKKSGRVIYSARCKKCQNEYNNNRYHTETPEKRLRRQELYYKSHLARKYGLTTEQFSAMITEQNNRCKICNCDMETPQVDHNHTTGEVRSLLCKPCNMALGLLKENTDTLYNMISYLNNDKFQKD